MKGYLRISEAQEYCGVSKRTIYNWIKQRGLKYSKIKGVIMISVKELDDFIEKHSVSNSIQNEANSILSDLFK